MTHQSLRDSSLVKFLSADGYISTDFSEDNLSQTIDTFFPDNLKKAAFLVCLDFLLVAIPDNVSSPFDLEFQRRLSSLKVSFSRIYKCSPFSFFD